MGEGGWSGGPIGDAIRVLDAGNDLGVTAGGALGGCACTVAAGADPSQLPGTHLLAGSGFSGDVQVFPCTASSTPPIMGPKCTIRSGQKRIGAVRWLPGSTNTVRSNHWVHLESTNKRKQLALASSRSLDENPL
jgi:hypothetical protein